MRAAYFGPLEQIRLQAGCGSWWLHPDALCTILRSLGTDKFALVDGLLPESEVDALRETAGRLFALRQMRAGVDEQQGGQGGYWGEGNEGDFQNRRGPDRKWAMEGDHRAWIGGGDGRAAALRPFTAAVDALLTALGSGGITCADPSVTKRIGRIHFREGTMVACYPGEARGRYLRHCDTGRGAALTAILYLNRDWSAEDGGQLRLYEEGFHNTQVRADVAPLAGRLLLFWATEESPHEVLPARRDRFAMTIWCRDSGLMDAAGLADAILHCSPVAPLSLEQAVARAEARPS